MKWSHILACVVVLTVSATASKRPILWSSVTMEKRGLTTLNLQVLGTPGSQVLYLAGLPTYVVRRGDDIPAALSRRYTGDGPGVSDATREVGAGA